MQSALRLVLHIGAICLKGLDSSKKKTKGEDISKEVGTGFEERPQDISYVGDVPRSEV